MALCFEEDRHPLYTCEPLALCLRVGPCRQGVHAPMSTREEGSCLHAFCEDTVYMHVNFGLKLYTGRY